MAQQQKKKTGELSKTVAALPTSAMISPETPLDKSLTKKLEQFRELILNRHEQCIGAGIKLVEKFVRCGEPLAHARVFVGRGSFEKWIEDTFGRETGLGLRTAQRYMRAYRGFIEFLEERNAAPAPGSLAIVTTNKELLLAYCQHVMALREAEKKAKKKSPLRPLPEEILDAMKSFFGDFDFEEVKIHHAIRADAEYLFVDARQHIGDLESLIAQLLIAIDTNNLREALLLLPFESFSAPEALWSFPLAITRSPSLSDQRAASPKRQPARWLLIYLATQPDIPRFVRTLSDIAVAFVPFNKSIESPLTLTLAHE